MEKLLIVQISQEDLSTLVQTAVKLAMYEYRAEQRLVASETEWMSRRQAASYLGVSLPTLNEYTKRGIITSYNLGTFVRYKKHELREDVMKQNEPKKN